MTDFVALQNLKNDFLMLQTRKITAFFKPLGEALNGFLSEFFPFGVGVFVGLRSIAKMVQKQGRVRRDVTRERRDGTREQRDGQNSDGGDERCEVYEVRGRKEEFTKCGLAFIGETIHFTTLTPSLPLKVLFEKIIL